MTRLPMSSATLAVLRTGGCRSAEEVERGAQLSYLRQAWQVNGGQRLLDLIAKERSKMELLIAHFPTATSK